ncbi:hypothetical protein F5884DRAFT_342542 [Xylogone sp. PMI_703]|nr:hypothetical protein F5884DRAFT_342542 [Xylogone sp. PMI_703]
MLENMLSRFKLWKFYRMKSDHIQPSNPSISSLAESGLTGPSAAVLSPTISSPGVRPDYNYDSITSQWISQYGYSLYLEELRRHRTMIVGGTLEHLRVEVEKCEAGAPPLRLVNSNSLECQQVLDDVKYATVSYVWNQWLGKNITHVAAKVARRFGLDYLWIDAVCIKQDDDAEKASEIAKMGQYYSNAALNIIFIEANEGLSTAWDISRLKDDFPCSMDGLLTVAEEKDTELRMSQWAGQCKKGC